MEDWEKEIRTRPTVSVPFAGACLAGLSRNGSYEAAKAGHIKVVAVGKLKRVPTTWLRQQLGIEGE